MKPSSIESFNIHKPPSLKKQRPHLAPPLSNQPSLQASGLSKKNSIVPEGDIEELIEKYNSLKIKMDEFATPILLIHMYLIVKVFVSIYINIFHSQNNAVKSIGALLYHYTLRLFQDTMPVLDRADRTRHFYANETRLICPITESLVPVWKDTGRFESHSYLHSDEQVPIPSIPLTPEMEKTFEMEVFCNETMRIIGYFNRMILQVTIKFKNRVKRHRLEAKIEDLKRNKHKVGIADAKRYISGLIAKIESLKNF